MSADIVVPTGSLSGPPAPRRPSNFVAPRSPSEDSDNNDSDGNALDSPFTALPSIVPAPVSENVVNMLRQRLSDLPLSEALTNRRNSNYNLDMFGQSTSNVLECSNIAIERSSSVFERPNYSRQQSNSLLEQSNPKERSNSIVHGALPLLQRPASVRAMPSPITIQTQGFPEFIGDFNDGSRFSKSQSVSEMIHPAHNSHQKRAVYKSGLSATGWRDALSTLVSLGLNLDDVTVDGSGDTVLHIASERGYADGCRVLLSLGANVNGVSSSGRTALHYAAEHDRKEVIEVLAIAGANLTITDNNGVTPLHLACMHGAFSAVEMLCVAGANPNAPLDSNHLSPLCLAARQNNVRIVRFLIATGAKVDIDDREIRSNTEYESSPPTFKQALYIATELGHVAIVRHLLAAGANVDAQCGPLNRTALMAACEKDDKEIISLLLLFRANPCIMDSLGWNSAHVAANRGHMSVVIELIAAGASLAGKSRGAIFQ